MATTPLSYTGTDPKKIAASNRSQIYGQGQQLTAQQLAEQQQNEQQGQGYEDYLGNIEDPLARGEGGYNSDETGQIEYSPGDVKNLVNSAGISAGADNAAAVGGAERATAAAGGNPTALMAYRARAAQQQGVNAGNAMTQARATGKQLQQQGAEAVGNARLGQQTQGLQYYQGIQNQKNTNAQQDLGLQGQTYGTQTGGLTGSASTAQSASQNPTTLDKIIGAGTTALSFLEGGSPGTGTDAVLGEDGPEKVVDMSAHDYMADGDFGGETNNPTTPMTPRAPSTQPSTPWWKKFTSNTVAAGGGGQQAPHQWNPVDTYKGIGQVAGKIGSALMHRKPAAAAAQPAMDDSAFMADGGFAQGQNGIFTEPTEVELGPHDGVVPLNYRPGAKVRPSMAALPAARGRQMYGGARA